MAIYLEHKEKGLLKIEKTTFVGRREGNFQFPEDKAMSTLHFKLIVKNSKIYLVDLQSKNKTFLNQESIDPQVEYLAVIGSTIRAGDQEFKLVKS